MILQVRCKARAGGSTHPRMTIHAFRFLCVTALALACIAATDQPPSSKALQNLGKDGLALKGHDPVAFFTIKAPVKGRPEYASQYHGARYLFVSAKNKAAFDARPDKYEPAFGGYCAYGVSRGKLVDIDVDAFQVVHDRLLLQYSTGVRDDFNRDPEGNLRKADANWPGLVDRKGK